MLKTRFFFFVFFKTASVADVNPTIYIADVVFQTLDCDKNMLSLGTHAVFGVAGGKSKRWKSIHAPFLSSAVSFCDAFLIFQFFFVCVPSPPKFVEACF